MEVASWGSEWGEERLTVDTEGPMEVASWGSEWGEEHSYHQYSQEHMHKKTHSPCQYMFPHSHRDQDRIR